MKKKIWIDVSNSPHVLFFRPIIKLLQEKGYSVTVTCRDFAQTKELLDKFNIKYIEFGKHGGKNLLSKIFNLILRSWRLYFFAKKHKFNLALSHNSIEINLISKILKIPVINFFDYEFAQFHHINFRCATKVVCPSYISSKKLYKFGAENKIIKYNGLKEQMYLYDYKFDKNILKKLNLNSKKIIVILRPPAETALYHRKIKNNFYYKLIDFLGNNSRIQIVFLGRNKNQIEYIKNKKYSNYFIFEKAIDGPSLIKESDIVISAGGTMNREAAALGTPVYSILALKLGGVDKFLIKINKLIYLNNLNNLIFKKKKRSKNLNFINPSEFVDLSLKYIK